MVFRAVELNPLPVLKRLHQSLKQEDVGDTVKPFETWVSDHFDTPRHMMVSQLLYVAIQEMDRDRIKELMDHYFPVFNDGNYVLKITLETEKCKKDRIEFKALLRYLDDWGKEQEALHHLSLTPTFLHAGKVLSSGRDVHGCLETIRDILSFQLNQRVEI